MTDATAAAAEPTLEELFANAFDEADKADAPAADAGKTADAGAAPAAKAEGAAAAEGEKPAEGDDKGEEAGAEGEAAKGGEQAAEGAAAAEGEKPAAKPDAAAASSDDDLLKRFANLLQNANEAKPAPKAQEQQEQQQQQAPAFSDEEQQFLQGYEKDWSDVSKGEALKRRFEYQQLTNYIFGSIAAQLKPYLETIDQLATHTQLSVLKQQVPDYSEELVASVQAWVEKQPTYLQSAYKKVINEGDADEVQDLISRYKAENPGTKPAGQQPAPKVPPKKETELPPAAKQAAAALAPVSSKRSAISNTIDPNDFDSAFAAFADKIT